MSLPTFSMDVVGCKVNQVEAAMLKAQFEQEGFHYVEDKQAASLVLLHTCTVTHKADRDCRRFIDQVTRLYPRAHLVLSGCYAVLEKENLIKVPQVLAVIDQQNRYRAAQLVQARLAGQTPDTTACDESQASSFFGCLSGVSFQGRARAAIKIQDGCNGTCSYCRVRLARGPASSRPVGEVINEIQVLLDQGYQELVLTGVNLAAYDPGLDVVLERIARLSGNFRIRLSSLEPQFLSERLKARLLAHKAWCCPHLHLPIQSGADSLLRAMNRPYTSARVEAQLLALKAQWPNLTLTADMIVGFPGETEEEFGHSLRLAQTLELAKIHVFPFSPRPGTSAATMPHQVQSRVVTERARKLRQLSEQLGAHHRAAMVGQQVTVLLEQSTAEGTWAGTTGEYDRALIKTAGRAGQLVKAKIQAVQGQWLLAGSSG